MIMFNRKTFDPCARGNALEKWCNTMKYNKENPGVAMLRWVILAIIIVVGDVLKWFPAIVALFPDVYTYDITNLVVDLLFIVLTINFTGLPGFISILKLADSLIYFVLMAYFPWLGIYAFWIEVIPWFSIAVVVYFIYETLVPDSPKQ